MNAFQIEYTVFGGALILAGLTMIATYSASYPWWRDMLGRMMVIYASAEILMASLLMSTIVFKIGPLWFRPMWFGLQSAITLCFLYQTWMIVRLRRHRVNLNKVPRPREPHDGD